MFATLNPEVVVVRSGIHFHHFWYGLAMIACTGWLGITLRDERMGRNLAIIFGLGAGLIGDEVGLLLTFGDYTSNLTGDILCSSDGVHHSSNAAVKGKET